MAIKKWRKKQEYATEFRKIYSSNLSDLHAQRLLAAVEEHNFKMEHFMSSLTKVCFFCGILKTLKLMFCYSVILN